MSKQTYESWVSSFVERLAEHFNFQGWELSIEFSAEPGVGQHEGAYAMMQTNGDYQMATLTVFPMAKADWEKKNFQVLSRRLIHELCHLFFDPLHIWMLPHLSETTKPLFIATLEQQTQKLAMVLSKTLPQSVIPR